MWRWFSGAFAGIGMHTSDPEVGALAFILSLSFFLVGAWKKGGDRCLRIVVDHRPHRPHRPLASKATADAISAANREELTEPKVDLPGVMIVFEGIDGSGKTHMIRALEADLQDKGMSVIRTREPGGSPGAEEIRRLILEGEPQRWSAETDLLLFTAARRDHFERTILPELQAGSVVLCDRFIDSTRVYQGLRRPELREKIDLLHAMMIGFEPDLTILLDLPAEIGLERAFGRNGHEERFEEFGVEVQRHRRQAFRDLAAANPERFRVIDAERDIETVATDVLSVVHRELGGRTTA